MSSSMSAEEEQQQEQQHEPAAEGDTEGDDDSVVMDDAVKPTFFSEISFCELAYGVGSVNLNSLCIGMMLNIPTLTLHNIMYSIAPKGLVHEESTVQERIHVCKAILDHWMFRTRGFPSKRRFKQLYDAFMTLKEKDIANELKVKFQANEPIFAEMFLKLDVGRLGPWIPPEETASTVPSEGYGGEEEEEDNESGV